VIDTRLWRIAAWRADGQRKNCNVDGTVGKIDGVVLSLLNDRHTHRRDKELRHGVRVRRAIGNVSNLGHYPPPKSV
jgi:hypothetical protein